MLVFLKENSQNNHFVHKYTYGNGYCTKIHKYYKKLQWIVGPVFIINAKRILASDTIQVTDHFFSWWRNNRQLIIFLLGFSVLKVAG